MDKYKTTIIVLIALILGVIIYNYVYLQNYPFKLNGSDTILLNIGDTWDDPLYTVDGDKEVTIKDNTNNYIEGKYEKKYSLRIGLFSKTLTRNIIVSKDNNAFNFKLKGSNPYYLMLNQQYEENGYEAYDEKDGNLTNTVQVTNNINNQVPGEYEVVYKVKNSGGITKEVIREIIVYSFDFEGKLETMDYTDKNEIIISINDVNYDYTILPNGNRTNNRNINYSVNKNDSYLFKIYDINNNFINYKVNITNIDEEKPNGNCTLTLKDYGGEISVTAKDNGEIEGYEYQYGTNKTGIKRETTYQINTMDNEAKVTIYDTAGNTSDITCSIKDLSTIQNRNYTLKKYSNLSYWFYEPKKSKREKLPLVIYFHGAGMLLSEDAVNMFALPKFIKEGNDFPYYVLAPYNAYYSTTDNTVLDIINYLVDNYQIDSKRIALSGGSAGSPPALRMMSNYPNLFSCIIIVAGYSETPSTDVSKLTKRPMWFFQGTNDSYQMIENYVNKINNAGGNAKLTPYKGGHDAPLEAFFRTDLTNWISTNKS